MNAFVVDLASVATLPFAGVDKSGGGSASANKAARPRSSQIGLKVGRIPV
jgi:hypothetical protein